MLFPRIIFSFLMFRSSRTKITTIFTLLFDVLMLAGCDLILVSQAILDEFLVRVMIVVAKGMLAD